MVEVGYFTKLLLSWAPWFLLLLPKVLALILAMEVAMRSRIATFLFVWEEEDVLCGAVDVMVMCVVACNRWMEVCGKVGVSSNRNVVAGIVMLPLTLNVPFEKLLFRVFAAAVVVDEVFGFFLLSSRCKRRGRAEWERACCGGRHEVAMMSPWSRGGS